MISDNNATWKRGRSYFLPADPPFSHRQHVQGVISSVGRSVVWVCATIDAVPRQLVVGGSSALPRDLSPIIGAPGSVHSASSRKRRTEVTAVALLRVHLFFIFLFFFADVDLRSRGTIAFAIKRPGNRTRHSLSAFLHRFTMLVAITKPSERGRRVRGNNMIQVENMSR